MYNIVTTAAVSLHLYKMKRSQASSMVLIYKLMYKYSKALL